MMGRMRRGPLVIAVALASGSVLASGGCGVTTFACSNDAQCTSGVVSGLCQPSGYCSFPDQVCASGQRFGEAAPAELAGECVEPEPTTDTTGPGSSSGGDTQPDPSQGLEVSTLDPAESSTTVALDEGGTSTGPAVTTDPSSTDDTTTGAVEDCVMLVDEFDGMGLDPMWTPILPGGGSVEQLGGQLFLTIPPSTDWVTTRVTTDLGPIAGGWERLWISEIDQPELQMTSALFLNTAICELQIYVSERAVRVFLWNDEEQVGTSLANADLPGLPIALQIRVDEAGVAHFEHSQDGSSWDSIADGSFPECGDLTQPLVGAVATGGLIAQEGTRAFDRFEACLPPPA
jgi:hypothetical protein